LTASSCSIALSRVVVVASALVLRSLSHVPSSGYLQLLLIHIDGYGSHLALKEHSHRPRLALIIHVLAHPVLDITHIVWDELSEHWQIVSPAFRNCVSFFPHGGRIALALELSQTCENTFHLDTQVDIREAATQLIYSCIGAMQPCASKLSNLS
jgi:hypothetical protein